ncbi:MAG: DNA repair protein RecO [Clostridia bacterium]|nr:DNA repair protein RecO [Clostridia bacterium]
MGTIKTKGIIIAENNMDDFDKMLTMITPGMGKISCAAKGARRPKSLLLGGTQFLCFGDYVLYKGGETYNINSCEPIEIFYNIRTDLDKLKYAVHITKIINDVVQENQNCYKILQLFLNTLYVISEKEKDLDLVLAIFKLKLLAIIGYMPNVRTCSNCGKTENIDSFSFKNNGFLCGDCSKQDTSSVHISENTKASIQYIIMSESKKIYSFDMPENDLKELRLVAKIYFDEKLEKEYKMEELF